MAIVLLVVALSGILAVASGRSGLAPIQVQVRVSEDTYVESDHTEVRGDESSLEVRFTWTQQVSYTLLKFNLAAVPSGARVVSMTLSVVVLQALFPLTVGTYLSSNTYWNERTLVWSSASFARQTTPQPSDSKLVSSPGRSFEFDLNAFAPFASGRSALTLVLRPLDERATGATGVVRLYSKDQPDYGRVPKLSITYEQPLATTHTSPATDTASSETTRTGGPTSPGSPIALPDLLRNWVVVLGVATTAMAGLLIWRFMTRARTAGQPPAKPVPSVQGIPEEAAQRRDEYTELVTKLEDLRLRGEISDAVYNRLRAEYEKKLRA